MSILSKISLLISSVIMIFYFSIQSLLVFDILEYTKLIGGIGYTCFLFFVPFFFIVVREFVLKNRVDVKMNIYTKKLNDVLVSQSHNHLFFQGLVSEGAKELTSEVTESINTDRCSIWLYNKNKTSIICQQLYVKSEYCWYNNIELSEKDFKPYFESLRHNPIIVANDAEKHPATSCFTDSYLKPLGIKSMLDVPIMFRGEVIGVICIESLTKREWCDSEINFAKMLSSLYSFSYSVKQSNKQDKKLEEMNNFINESAIITKADNKGKITYVNKKFCEVSGYTVEDVLGKDHKIVNSGKHPKEIWTDMYKTTIKDKKIWNKIITNRAKNGDLYYVDTYIRAEFDSETQELTGFTSIRQDVTELKRKELDIRNRMNAINQSNMVIEFDIEGNIKFANDKFCVDMGYTQIELEGKHHSIFVEESYKKSKDYENFWKTLKDGKFISSQFKRLKKNGEQVWIQSTYNPIFDSNGRVVKIMKIATDITDKVLQSLEIEKKNTYLEHAAKILRHDMHSGINTYIPRGVSSLERRLTEDDIKNLKIESPLKMIKEGLKHTQKVYKGVYEFTNLVKKDVVLSKELCNVKSILEDYLSSTSYKSQVLLDDNLPELLLNESLFCTSIDNLIRNGLKYNDSQTKWVKIYLEGGKLCVEDNGRGLTQKDFDELSKPYVRKQGQKETGSGLGLNICIAILKEHGFSITCQKVKTGGTKIKIKI